MIRLKKSLDEGRKQAEKAKAVLTYGVLTTYYVSVTRKTWKCRDIRVELRHC